MNEVTNTLDEPILARYIRIHPVEWVGYISFRFELYGCYSGKLRRLIRREKFYISHLLIKALQGIHIKQKFVLGVDEIEITLQSAYK